WLRASWSTGPIAPARPRHRHRSDVFRPLHPLSGLRSQRAPAAAGLPRRPSPVLPPALPHGRRRRFGAARRFGDSLCTARRTAEEHVATGASLDVPPRRRQLARLAGDARRRGLALAVLVALGLAGCAEQRPPVAPQAPPEAPAATTVRQERAYLLDPLDGYA